MKYKCVCQTFKTNTTNRCKNRSFPFCYWFINGSTAIWTLFIMHFLTWYQKIQMTELTEWPTKHSHKSQRVAKTNTILFRLTFVKKTLDDEQKIQLQHLFMKTNSSYTPPKEKKATRFESYFSLAQFIIIAVFWFGLTKKRTLLIRYFSIYLV